MTHPTNMAPVDGVRCCDLPTSREWLRALASNLALVRTWWVIPMIVAHLLVHFADVWQVLRTGRVAVLYPVRTGGSDHSLRAVLAGASPMVAGGDFTTGAACMVRHRKRAPNVITWSVPRHRIVSAARSHTGRVTT